jgi:hypothetical protein
MAEVSLELIFEHQKQMMEQMRGLRDDMTVVMGRLDRIERRMDALEDEVRGLRRDMHTELMRTRRLEERMERLQEERTD